MATIRLFDCINRAERILHFYVIGKTERRLPHSNLYAPPQGQKPFWDIPLDGMQGRPFCFLERQRIELYLIGHVSLRSMGKMLHRNHGVISKELGQNNEPDGTYSSVKAQAKADARQEKNRRRTRKLNRDPLLRAYVIQELKRNQSPDVIAGVLKLHPPPELKGASVSHETIYRWIYEGNERWEGLHKYLCKGRKKGWRRYARKVRKTHIPDRVSIHERPEGINERRDIGHWESDSMVFSKQRERLSVQYEIKARYVVIHRLPNGTAEATDEALQDSIQSLPQNLWKTLTFDNGGEGTNHSNLQREYGIQTYFCDPYASWQKGGVENVNGIIRRYLPRHTIMSQITRQDIYEIQQKKSITPRGGPWDTKHPPKPSRRSAGSEWCIANLNYSSETWWLCPASGS